MRVSNHFVGTVGSEPRPGTLPDGRPYANFRMAVNHEFYNPETKKYQEGDTSWFDVAVYGTTGQNVASTVKKGDPVIVIGRLRVRDWETGEKSGTSAEIIAEAVGQNLRFGTGSFQRSGRRRTEETAAGGHADGSVPERPETSPAWAIPAMDSSAPAAPPGAGDAGDGFDGADSPEPQPVGASAGAGDTTGADDPPF